LVAAHSSSKKLLDEWGTVFQRVARMATTEKIVAEAAF